jgi:hypothetical protein
LRVAIDPRRPEEDRDAAAALVAFVCSRWTRNEAVVEGLARHGFTYMRLLRALAQSLESTGVVRLVARAAVGLSRSNGIAAAECLRLAAVARDRGLLESEYALLTAALEVEEAEVPSAAIRRATDHAATHCDKLSVMLLLLRLLERFGPRSAHVRALVRQRPEVQGTRLLCTSTLLLLLAAEPTAEGWLVVALRMGALSRPPTKLLKLVRRSPRARLAMAKAIDGPFDQSLRATLARWRDAASDLSGSALSSRPQST